MRDCNDCTPLLHTAPPLGMYRHQRHVPCAVQRRLIQPVACTSANVWPSQPPLTTLRSYLFAAVISGRRLAGHRACSARSSGLSPPPPTPDSLTSPASSAPHNGNGNNGYSSSDDDLPPRPVLDVPNFDSRNRTRRHVAPTPPPRTFNPSVLSRLRLFSGGYYVVCQTARESVCASGSVHAVQGWLTAALVLLLPLLHMAFC